MNRKVLHVGCGPKTATKLHAAFRGPQWREVRLDIDEEVKPDLVGTMVDMNGLVADDSFDAIWSSHNLEHLYAHETPMALQEFRRVLNPDGFALINCPNVLNVARLIVEGQFDQPVYNSPAGPISPLDILWGHSRSIAGGNHFMAHKTGFTTDSLGRQLIENGFAEAWVFAGDAYDIWAVALMDDADREMIRFLLTRNGLALPSESD